MKKRTEQDVFDMFEQGDSAGFIPALQDKSAKIREAAQFCLANRLDRQILYAALSTKDKRLRESVEEALSISGTAEANDILSALQKDENEAIRKLASGALGMEKAPAVKPSTQEPKSAFANLPEAVKKLAEQNDALGLVDTLENGKSQLAIAACEALG